MTSHITILPPQDLRGAPVPTMPDLVFYMPKEKWILRHGDTWDLACPVSRLGAKAFLLSHLGWPPHEVDTYFKTPEHQILVYGEEMVPNQPPLCIGTSGRMVMNLWRPPTLVPKAGNWPTISRVLDHVTNNAADGRDWLIQWMAQKVQNPNCIPKVAVLLATAHGGGKGFLARVMFEILGTDNCAIVKQHELENKFNKRWVRKLFVMGDEVLSNDNIKDISQLLKILVDGGELELEGKYENQTSVRSRLAWMFSSNDRISPLSLEATDRRYSVFNNFDEVPKEYATALSAMFEADRVTPTAAFLEEIAAFAAHLLSVEVNTDLVRRPHGNEAREGLIEANRPSHEAFCLAADEHGIDVLLDATRMRDDGLMMSDPKDWDFGEYGVSTQALYSAYKTYCRDSGQRPLKLNKFGAALTSYKSAKYPALWESGLNTIKGTKRQVRCYVVPRTPKDGGAE